MSSFEELQDLRVRLQALLASEAEVEDPRLVLEQVRCLVFAEAVIPKTHREICYRWQHDDAIARPESLRGIKSSS